MKNSFKFWEKLKGQKLRGVAYGYGTDTVYLLFGKRMVTLDVTNLECETEKL